MKETPRIIVGVGDIQDGARALTWALTEARRRGAQLHAIRAWHDIGRPGPMTADWGKQLEEAAGKTLTEAFDLATGGAVPSFSCRLLTREGATAEVLLRYADRDDDMIVLGASRHGPWWPFGQKTVRACVRKAGCPVVVVPQAALARAASMRKLVRELRRELRQMEKTNA